MATKKRRRGNPRPVTYTELFLTRMEKKMKKDFEHSAIEEGFSSASALNRFLITQHLEDRKTKKTEHRA